MIQKNSVKRAKLLNSDLPPIIKSPIVVANMAQYKYNAVCIFMHGGGKMSCHDRLI